MTRVRVECFTISIDGYGAGPSQDLQNPLGVGGTELHQWLLPTRTLQRTLFGNDGGTTGVDDAFAARGFENVGAWILGRNMFGPIRGPWPDESWKGWWGDDPPYHCSAFVLTHHARPPLVMKGGTTFHFVTGGIREALDRARVAAAGKDVRIGGGASTIRQYLREGLVDEMHVAISPVVLGAGERLFEGVDVRALGYECARFVASDKATHVVLRRRARQRYLTSKDRLVEHVVVRLADSEIEESSTPEYVRCMREALAGLRGKLELLERALESHGEAEAAARIRRALDGPDSGVAAFLVSNELWGGSGSLADQAGVERTWDAAPDPGREGRKAIEAAFLDLGSEQIRQGHVNVRTAMWVEAFSSWRGAGP